MPSTRARSQGRRADDRTGWRQAAAGTVSLAGLDLEVTSLREAVTTIDELRNDSRAHLVVTINVDQTLHARRDDQVQKAFEQASLRYVDGAPLVALARLLGVQIPGRVTGADLVPTVCAFASRHGRRVAFVGAAPGVARQAADALCTRYPGLDVALVDSPPYGFDSEPGGDRYLIELLKQAEADFVFVALGSPRQEMWIHHRRHALPPGVYIGVGAALDFASGRKVRASGRWQRFGLEWLHRLLHDPARLWKRYLVNDLSFLKIVAAELRRGRRAVVQRVDLTPQQRARVLIDLSHDTSHDALSSHGEPERIRSAS